MKTDIILCGVGGQGILSIATIIGEAAMKENLYIKQEIEYQGTSVIIPRRECIQTFQRHLKQKKAK